MGLRKRILFVDDESNVLQGLARSLRSMRNEWEMLFAGSGAEALSLLGREPCQVIVSDILMPEMDGVTLLGEVSKRHPEVVRLMLSGSDQETLMAAVGLAHGSLLKPCTSETVRAILSRSCSLFDLRARVRAELERTCGPERTALDVDSTLKVIVDVARPSWGEKIEIDWQLDGWTPMVSIGREDFVVVLLNVLGNGAQAVVEAVAQGRTPGRMTLGARTDGDFVELSITDTGPGIPEQIRPKIFAPFFTTRGPQSGTGQGLALSQQLVQRQGGTITFDSEVGRGTTFRIRLPAAPASSREEHR